MPETREASANDIEQIVSIHMTAFQGFFLTRLGPAFLRELYTGFIDDDTGGLFVTDTNGEILGFVAGTVDPDGFFKRLRKRRWPAFFLKALPGVIRSPGIVIRKLISAIHYSGDTPDNQAGGALVSSLAVSPRARKQGVGNTLIERFNKFALEHKNKYIYVITDKEENIAVIRFYEELGFVIDSVITRQNNRRMYRLVKCLAGN